MTLSGADFVVCTYRGVENCEFGELDPFVAVLALVDVFGSRFAAYLSDQVQLMRVRLLPRSAL